MSSTKKQTEIVRKMDKQALRMYGVLAFAVYCSALAYCYFTHHLLEGMVVGVVMLGLGVLIANVYRSLSPKQEKRPSQNYSSQESAYHN